LIIIVFRIINDDSVITAVFKVAGYTYGPLLGLYSFGLFTKWKTKDSLVPYVAIAAPILTFFASHYSGTIIPGYNMGFELLILNGLITFIGLMIIRKK
jgi:hypothetical protein